MEPTRTFSAETEAELWAQVAADLDRLDSPLEYQAQLQQGPYQAGLDIDVDPGGGFEGGYTITTLHVRVPGHPALRFALYEQTWVQQLGKLLGQEDVILGYPELDDAFIINTNDVAALQALLADPELRRTLLRFPTLHLNLEPASLAADADVRLTFTYEAAILSSAQLRDIYHALMQLAQQLASQHYAAPPMAG
jgi:hypothetical protein